MPPNQTKPNQNKSLTNIKHYLFANIVDCIIYTNVCVCVKMIHIWKIYMVKISKIKDIFERQ